MSVFCATYGCVCRNSMSPYDVEALTQHLICVLDNLCSAFYFHLFLYTSLYSSLGSFVIYLLHLPYHHYLSSLPFRSVPLCIDLLLIPFWYMLIPVLISISCSRYIHVASTPPLHVSPHLLVLPLL